MIGSVEKKKSQVFETKSPLIFRSKLLSAQIKRHVLHTARI